MEFSHVPVLAEACMEGLNIRPDGVYIDSTTGGGGHSALIAERLSGGRLICLDRDRDALEAAGKRLAPFGDRVTFVKTNFEDMAERLHELGITQVDGILYDLGVSSWQLDSAERGFAYSLPSGLDMRMDRDAPLTAREVVNSYPRETLRDIIARYGEERYAGLIAAAIVRAREKNPVETTTELSELIIAAMPAAARREKQHPAKRTFQAIRLEVNGELQAVEKGVEAGIDLLAKNGRIAVISFHSLEDRLVKQAFANGARGCTCPKEFPVCVCGNKPRLRLISKGVITATAQELEENPRSRSAKLRVAEKL